MSPGLIDTAAPLAARFTAPSAFVEAFARNRETIETVGAMQPHGFLLGLDQQDRVQLCSGTVERFLQRPLHAVLGETLPALLGKAPAAALLGALHTSGASTPFSAADHMLPALQLPTAGTDGIVEGVTDRTTAGSFTFEVIAHRVGQEGDTASSGVSSGFTGAGGGVVAISVSKLQNTRVFWFRKELVETEHWAGDPNEPAELAAGLQVANEELEAFSYSVSHDLRAPFRHISGFAEMLREEEAARLSEKGRHSLATILDSARFAGLLVDSVLEHARLRGRASRASRCAWSSWRTRSGRRWSPTSKRSWVAILHLT